MEAEDLTSKLNTPDNCDFGATIKEKRESDGEQKSKEEGEPSTKRPRVNFEHCLFHDAASTEEALKYRRENKAKLKEIAARQRMIGRLMEMDAERNPTKTMHPSKYDYLEYKYDHTDPPEREVVTIDDDDDDTVIGKKQPNDVRREDEDTEGDLTSDKVNIADGEHVAHEVEVITLDDDDDVVVIENEQQNDVRREDEDEDGGVTDDDDDEDGDVTDDEVDKDDGDGVTDDEVDREDEEGVVNEEDDSDEESKETDEDTGNQEVDEDDDDVIVLD